jgi:hypothetical protein
MDNAFDKKAPPIVTGLPKNTTGTETDASAYDPIGRRYYLGCAFRCNPAMPCPSGQKQPAGFTPGGLFLVLHGLPGNAALIFRKKKSESR